MSDIAYLRKHVKVLETSRLLYQDFATHCGRLVALTTVGAFMGGGIYADANLDVYLDGKHVYRSAELSEVYSYFETWLKGKQ